MNKSKKKLIEIPFELFQELSKEAKRNERSLSKEIIYQLKTALKSNTNG